jgi:hypothetical protein
MEQQDILMKMMKVVRNLQAEHQADREHSRLAGERLWLVEEHSRSAEERLRQAEECSRLAEERLQLVEVDLDGERARVKKVEQALEEAQAESISDTHTYIASGVHLSFSFTSICCLMAIFSVGRTQLPTTVSRYDIFSTLPKQN